MCTVRVPVENPKEEMTKHKVLQQKKESPKGRKKIPHLVSCLGGRFGYFLEKLSPKA